MKVREFIRGQKAYSEGTTEIDGVYFIQEGEFEVTQKLDTDKTKSELKVAKKALSRTLSTSKTFRSQFHLQKIDGGTIGFTKE